MSCTRPDICWIVTKLSQNLTNPTNQNWTAAKHVLRYIKGSLDKGLCFQKSSKLLEVIGFSDADWGSSESDRSSISGYCFSLTTEGPAISWKSKKQSSIALSTCEAEYIALSMAAQESIYLLQLMKDIDPYNRYDSSVIYEDNQGAIALTKNPVKHGRTKHIDIRYHFIRSQVESGKICLKYMPTDQMVADMFTKSVPKCKLVEFEKFVFG